jgi:hypothetical protein
VLIDRASVPTLLAEHGVRAAVRDSFGAGVRLHAGLHTIVGRKNA